MAKQSIFGLVSFDSSDKLDVATVIRALDKQLYAAKHSGRDKVSAMIYKHSISKTS